MSNILTPLSLWNNFDDSLELNSEKISETIYDGVKIERVAFDGRDTFEGRVRIAACFASCGAAAGNATVLVLPDSDKTIDGELIYFLAKRGYSVLMVDYRGEWEGCEHHTVYPENVFYANTARCGHYKDFVDDSADLTSWYEWVSVGLYARKYIVERTGSEDIAVLGIRDGGEIAWKLGVAGKFNCIVPVCAAGWKAYNGVNKYSQEEPALDDERYRFIAGIDSQAYAPYIRCPALLLCSTNDPAFDYDRAYDTYTRINPEFLNESSIAYSMQCSAVIGAHSVEDMFLFLDKNLKNRQVFIPKPAEVFVEMDENCNLVARAVVDEQGVAVTCNIFLAEDCQNSSLREWSVCKPKDGSNRTFYLNIYEKTSTIFVLCRVRYANSFSVWSKVVAKKISGKFRNMQSKCRVLYSDANGVDGFVVADTRSCAIGGIFLANAELLPRLVNKARGVSGAYSEYGLTTYRMSNPRYAATNNSVLSLYLFAESDTKITLAIHDLATGEDYYCIVNVVGGAWQSVVLESKAFKTDGGASLIDYTGEKKFTVDGPVGYAVNNIVWL